MNRAQLDVRSAVRWRSVIAVVVIFAIALTVALNLDFDAPVIRRMRKPRPTAGRKEVRRPNSAQQPKPKRQQPSVMHMFVLTSTLPNEQYLVFLKHILLRLQSEKGRWRVTWVILIDKFTKNSSFFGTVVTWLKNEAAVASAIGLQNFSSVASEGLKWWTRASEVWTESRKVLALVTQGELLPVARALRAVKKSLDFYPDLVHETFPKVWFYHLDGDNTVPCCFFGFTEKMLANRTNAQMFICSQLRQNNIRFSPWKPVPSSIDTAQVLVHSNLLHKYNISWGTHNSSAPDGDFIRDAHVAAKNESSVIQNDAFCSFHNRLKWKEALLPCNATADCKGTLTKQ